MGRVGNFRPAWLVVPGISDCPELVPGSQDSTVRTASRCSRSFEFIGLPMSCGALFRTFPRRLISDSRGRIQRGSDIIVCKGIRMHWLKLVLGTQWHFIAIYT